MWSEARTLSSSLYCCAQEAVAPPRRLSSPPDTTVPRCTGYRNLQKYGRTSSNCRPLIISKNKPKLLQFRVRNAVDDKDPYTSSSAPTISKDERSSIAVEDSVKILKNAAQTRKVPSEEVLAALSNIEKAKLDPSPFLQTLGGSESPGRTWMLIYTAEKKLNGGRYFPLTAVQRFDAAGKRIENGVYLGPVGSLTFEGRISWKNRILAFIFECIRIKIGPLKPLEINLGGKDNREPSSKDPFFVWFYVDEEIAVARGKSGGTAFWCRCRRVSTG